MPKSNTIAKEIFDKYHDQLSDFKYRYYAIAKWIVRDIRKAGFIFKYLEDYPSIYIPVYAERNEPTSSETLSEQEKLYLFYYEMEFIKMKMSNVSLENEYQSI